MISTILPNGRSTVLPISPTDKQIFIDSKGIRWTYNAAIDLWEKSGAADIIQLANNTTTGAMSAADKHLLNSIPAVPGGFGIIVDTKLVLQTPNNPEGVIRGDIKLLSESLDIVCVGADRIKLNCPTPLVLECAIPDGNTPGLSFKLSDKFLSTLFVRIPGIKGRPGATGVIGDDGDPGLSDGPRGVQGKTGATAAEVCKLTNIVFNDLPGVTDTSIVDLQMAADDGHGSRMAVTKSKLNIQNTVADKIIATPLSRSVQFTIADGSQCAAARLANWELLKATTDATPLNLQLVRLPHNVDDPTIPVNFNATLSLNDFVTDIVTEYQARLQKIDKQWGAKVKSYIENIDDQARAILSNLANDLAMCEFNLPSMDYCITLAPCSAPITPPPLPPPPPPPTSPAAFAAGDANAIHNTVTTNRHINTIMFGGNRWGVNS